VERNYGRNPQASWNVWQRQHYHLPPLVSFFHVFLSLFACYFYLLLVFFYVVFIITCYFYLLLVTFCRCFVLLRGIGNTLRKYFFPPFIYFFSGKPATFLLFAHFFSYTKFCFSPHLLLFTFFLGAPATPLLLEHTLLKSSCGMWV